MLILKITIAHMWSSPMLYWDLDHVMGGDEKNKNYVNIFYHCCEGSRLSNQMAGATVRCAQRATFDWEQKPAKPLPSILFTLSCSLPS